MFRFRLAKSALYQKRIAATGGLLVRERDASEEAAGGPSTRPMPSLRYQPNAAVIPGKKKRKRKPRRAGHGRPESPDTRTKELSDADDFGMDDLGILDLDISPAENTDFDIAQARDRSSVQWLRSNPNLHLVGGDASAFSKFEVALQMVESVPVGRVLLDCLATATNFKQKDIRVYCSSTVLGTSPHDMADARNGRGTGSDVHLNFEIAEDYHRRFPNESLDKLHAAIVFHELLHALRNLAGERVVVEPSNANEERWPPLLHDEARTVGLGSFDSEALTENKFRAEIGLPRRESYSLDGTAIYDDDTADVGFQRRKLFPRD